MLMISRMSTTASPAVPRRRLSGASVAALVFGLILLTPVVVGVVVVLQNNAAARTIEGQLVSMPLPPSTELIDSYSRAGKLVGNGNGMQYLGAMLLHSELTVAELEAFYSDQAEAIDESRTSELASQITVERSASTQLSDISGMSTFLEAGGVDGFVVYMWGDAPSWFHRDVDLRGH
jgi:hypothetical protein